MARSHHRKKHKAHLRQYQHAHEPATAKPATGKIAATIAIIGVILGAAVGYFSTDGQVTWIAFGAVIGGLAGYLTGYYVDKQDR